MINNNFRTGEKSFWNKVTKFSIFSLTISLGYDAKEYLITRDGDLNALADAGKPTARY